MSLRVREDCLIAENQLGENTLQAVFQGVVELPSLAAPIARVVWVKGYPMINSLGVEQDRVHIQGVIDIQMVYAPETLEEETALLEQVDWPGALPFDHYVEVIGAEPGMVPDVDFKILSCEWEVRADQRLIDLDVITSALARVSQTYEYNVLTSANITPPKKLITDDLGLNTRVPVGELPFRKEISGILELPPDAEKIETILDLSCKPVIPGFNLSQSKVSLQGMTTVDLIYQASDTSVHCLTFEGVLPFEYEHAHPRLTTDTLFKEKIVPIWEGYVVNDGNALRIELQLSGTLQAYKQQSTRVLIDLASPAGDLVQSRKDTVYVDNFVNEKTQQSAAQGVVEIGERLPPIRELLRVIALPQMTDYRIDEDKILLEGVIDIEMIYLAHTEEETKPLFRGVFPNAIPFQQTIIMAGVEPGMKIHVSLEPRDVKPDLINRETVEVMVALRSHVCVNAYLQVEVVVEAVEIEPEDLEPPSIRYVFIQEGDTVWKLARKYHSSEEAIFQGNPTLQDSPSLLKPGDKIRIPRK